jgi:hypothetical protein
MYFMNNSFKVLVISMLSALALFEGGCSGTSSTGQSIPLTSTTSITGCTSTGTSTNTCIPTLGSYGTTVVYQGLIAVTNAGLGQSYVQNVSYNQISPPQSLVKSDSYVQITLIASSNGPVLSTQLSVAGYNVANGETYFQPSAANASAGTIEFDALGSSLMPVDIISPTQPWDGSIADLFSITVNISNQAFGTVSLQRIE